MRVGASEWLPWVRVADRVIVPPPLVCVCVSVRDGEGAGAAGGGAHRESARRREAAVREETVGRVGRREWRWILREYRERRAQLFPHTLQSAQVRENHGGFISTGDRASGASCHSLLQGLFSQLFFIFI